MFGDLSFLAVSVVGSRRITRSVAYGPRYGPDAPYALFG
jgi:hypothetical protein